MKKAFTITFLFTIISFLSFAQKSVTDRYFRGEITTNSGEVIKGYINMDYEYPATFQDRVSYLTPEDYELVKSTGKLKMKLVKKLKPVDVKQFQLENGKKFVSVTYADLVSLGFNSFPKKYLLEEVVTGKLKLYKKFPSGEGLVSGDLATVGEQRSEYIKSNFELLLHNDIKNPKNISHVNLLDYISDNPTVLEKFKADDYGRLRQTFSSVIKMGDVSHLEHEQDLLNLLGDYNKVN